MILLLRNHCLSCFWSCSYDIHAKLDTQNQRMQNDTYLEGIISYCFHQWKASLRQSVTILPKRVKIWTRTNAWYSCILVHMKENDYWTTNLKTLRISHWHHTHDIFQKLRKLMHITTKWTTEGNKKKRVSKRIIIIATHKFTNNAQLVMIWSLE